MGIKALCIIGKMKSKMPPPTLKRFMESRIDAKQHLFQIKLNTNCLTLPLPRSLLIFSHVQFILQFRFTTPIFFVLEAIAIFTLSVSQLAIHQ